jgi:hypothetical protein
VIKPLSLTQSSTWDPARPDEPFLLVSRAMPGFCLKVWRTDGLDLPVPNQDVRMLANHPFKLSGINNVRSHYSRPPLTYELEVYTMAPIPEMPEELKSDNP